MANLLAAPANAEASGREVELSLLEREREEVSSRGRAQVVFVRGAPGVGKSFLFEQAQRTFASRGVPVFAGGADRGGTEPFALFRPMLKALLDHLAMSAVPQQRLSTLTAKLSALTASRSALSSASAEGARGLYDAVGEAFGLAGRNAPVFLLSDCDAADRASLDLLRYLLAVVTAPESKAQGLWVLSFRDGALPAPLAELTSKVSARQISLSGLDLEGIRAFLNRAEVVERLLNATGGSPQALETLLQQPSAPVDFLARRLERLDADSLAVLEAVALAPCALSLEVLQHAAHPSRPHAEVLDALVRAGWLAVRLEDNRVTYRCLREGDKAAVRSQVGDLEAKQLRLAQALAQTGQGVAAAELEWQANPAHAAHRALAAGQYLKECFAYDDAAKWHERALLHLPQAERSSARHALGEIYFHQARFRASAKSFLAAAREGHGPASLLWAGKALVRWGHLGRASLVLKCVTAEPFVREASLWQAEVLLTQGFIERALHLCGELSRGPAGEEQVDEVAAQARNLIGRAMLVRGEAAGAHALFEENAQKFFQRGFRQQAAWAKVNQGIAAFKMGDVERAMACYQSTDESFLLERGRALANLGSIYADSGDFELALSHLSQALQTFSRMGAGKDVAHAASNLSRLCHFLGDLGRSDELSEHALKLSRELKDPYLTASAHLNLGAVALERHQGSKAVEELKLAKDAFERLGNDGFAALASALKARGHLLSSERAQAAEELGLRGLEQKAAALPAASLELELTRAELCLLLGDLHGAGRAVARAKDALLDRSELEGPYRVHFTLARLKQAAGDDAGAQAELERSARLLDALVQRVPLAHRPAFLGLRRRAEVLARAQPELTLPKSMAGAVEKNHGLVGRSAALQRVLKQVDPVGRSQATVLIRGESGTGKELLAQALHDHSPRRAMPMVKVNCAAMVEELLLSELFGHEKGAFTGAARERKGRFELAEGGTLFLDEIGDISPKCQVALLRVLQERELERVGGTKTLKVDVRVICATHRDLQALIAEGRFRSDLYYRLKGVVLKLPALRERPEDLALLCEHFLSRAAREHGLGPKRLSEPALTLLKQHLWPGNVRELENVLSSAAIFSEGPVIGPDAFAHVSELRDLAPGVVDVGAPVVCAPGTAAASTSDGPLDFYELARQRGISLKDLRHQVEMQCIKRALLEAQGNISEAARLLKMKRSRLSQIVNAEAELKEVAHGDL